MTDLIPAPSGQLTVKQQAFVDAYVANGGKGTAAARTAGYAKASAHVEANRLLQKPTVIRAIFDATVLGIGAALPAALASMKKLSQSAKSEHVRQSASADLLDRAGAAAPKQVRVGGSLTVQFDLS